MEPTTRAEALRAAQRREAGLFPEGRPTLAQTGRLRDRYWRHFEDWLRTENIDFAALLSHC